MERELTAAIERKRPDIVICGRETFAGSVLPIVQSHRLPCVLRTAGAHISGISAGAHAQNAQRDLALVMNQMNGVVAQARHVKEELFRRE